MTIHHFLIGGCRVFVSGIDAFLFPFEKGDCKDYKTWRQADKGNKDKQTQLRDNDLEMITTLLHSETHKFRPELKYTKTGNIYQFYD
jgi:hypothetical protein